MIVVTGATGNVGRTLVQILVDADEKVTAVSRGSSPIDLPDGVQHAAADFANPESLRAAVAGADALYLLVAGEQMAFGADPRDIVAVATSSGVRRIVLQSSQAAGTRPNSPAYERIRAFEDAVRNSGVEWTILRAGGFATNAYAMADSVRNGRTIAAPFPTVGLPLIDPADIAAAAAAALRDSSHHGRTYTLTGPAPVTPRDQATAISEAIDAPIQFVELTRDQAKAHMLTFMPEPVADATLAIIGEPTPEEQTVSQDITQILGRPANTFAAWAIRNAAAFR